MHVIFRSTCLALLAAAAAAQQPVLVKGRVVDARFEPIAGAGVLVGFPDAILTADVLERPTVHTDAGGRFALSLSPLARDEIPRERCVHIAAPGKAAVQQAAAPGWNFFAATRNELDLGELVLEDAIEIKGRIRTKAGRPLRDARVTAADLLGDGSLRFPQGGFAPQLRSHAQSGADGTFRLPHAWASGLELLVDCPGYYRQMVAPVTDGEPLVLELTPSGVTHGRVTDANGKAHRGLLQVWYEASSECQELTTEADGSFALPVRFRGRYRVRCVEPASGRMAMFGEPPPVLGESEVLDGPRDGVAIRLTSAARGSIRVRARGPDGKPVAKTTASVAWGDGGPWAMALLGEPESPDDVAADAEGTVCLQAPAEGAGPTGLLRVRAPGCATFVQRDLSFEKDGQEVDVRLAPEAVLAGRVVDPDTGAGIAGAEVRVVPPAAGEGGIETTLLFLLSQTGRGAGKTTAADGAFRIGSLGKGPHQLFAHAEGRPDRRLLHVTLQPGQNKSDLTLKLPRGGTVKGKLTGGTAPPGARVAPQGEPGLMTTWAMLAGSVFGAGAAPDTGGGRVDAKGAFVLEGMASGLAGLNLVVPLPDRAGAPLVMPLDRVRVGAGETVEEEFDLARALPARWRGRVIVDGDPVPPGRLRVVACAGGGPDPAPRMDFAVTLRRTIPNADGSFSLLLPPGPHSLRVEDLVTGVSFAQLDPVKLGCGEQHEQDVKITVAKARVRLTTEEGRPLVAETLLVQSGDAEEEEDPLTGFLESYRGRGVSLSCAPAEVEVFVPPGRTRLKVVIDTTRLGHEIRWEHAALGELEFAAKAGAPQALTLKVAPPPDLPN